MSGNDLYLEFKENEADNDGKFQNRNLRTQRSISVIIIPFMEHKP